MAKNKLEVQGDFVSQGAISNKKEQKEVWSIWYMGIYR